MDGGYSGKFTQASRFNSLLKPHIPPSPIQVGYPSLSVGQAMRDRPLGYR